MNYLKSKCIYIINHYAGNTEVGLEYRHFLIAKELQKQGYKVYIIASTFTHLLDKEIDISEEYQQTSYDDIEYIWIKTPRYSGNGLSRFKNMFVFSYKLQKYYKRFDIQKPDYIIASSPHPFVVLNGYFMSQYYLSKFIFEERDLWPKSIIELVGFSNWHPLSILLQRIEDFAYKKADLIVSPLVNLEININERGIKHKDFLFLPNGILEEDMIDIMSKNCDIDKYTFSQSFLVGFAGTIGASNCVDTLVKSAKKLKDMDIGFVILGEGEQYQELKEFVKKYKLTNVYMIGRKDKYTTIAILKKCDVLYNASPKSELYKYGLSAIKVPEYMYLGKYIINAVDIKNDIIEIASCGSTIEPENVDVLVEEIKSIYDMDTSKLLSAGQKAKQYVVDNLLYKSLVTNFKNRIEKI
jgi:hypothetical protein